MSVMPYATVVGVFRDRTAANLAMEALLNAGFKREQMRYLVADNAGGFFDTLKSAFMGTSPVEESLVSNLTDMGLSSEEARYFSDEYERGSAILAIKTQGDQEMALNILYQYGAYNSKDRARFGGVMANPTYPSSSPVVNDYVVPVYPQAVAPEVVAAQFDENYTPRDYPSEQVQAESYIPATSFPPEVVSDPSTPLPQETVNDPTTPFPQEVARDPDALLPTEDANYPDALLVQETTNPDAPLPQEVASDPNLPLPEEDGEVAVDQVEQDAPEITETETVEEVVTPAYQDEQSALFNSDMVEIDTLEVNAQPLDQTSNDTSPQTDADLQAVYAATPGESDPGVQDVEVPTTETDDEDADEQDIEVVTLEDDDEDTDGQDVEVVTLENDDEDTDEQDVEAAPTDTEVEEQDSEVITPDATDRDGQDTEVRDAEVTPAEFETDSALDTYPQDAEPPSNTTDSFAPANVAPQTAQDYDYSMQSHAAELQQLLTQIETTRQQLETARAQLEYAKEHESRLTTARLQLKELQAELQAVQAELHETHQRTLG